MWDRQVRNEGGGNVKQVNTHREGEPWNKQVCMLSELVEMYGEDR